MQRSARFQIPILFVAVAFAGARLANAQTLVHRAPSEAPAEAAEPPAEAAPPQSIMPRAQLVLPLGTSLQVELPRQYPMKAGEPIRGKLLHPLFAEGRLAIPKDTMLYGKVVALEPDKTARLHGRLLGDFTPFHRAKVRFEEIDSPGRALPIDAAAAADGAPVLQLSAPGAAPRKSLIAREAIAGKGQSAEPGGMDYRTGIQRTRARDAVSSASLSSADDPGAHRMVV